MSKHVDKLKGGQADKKQPKDFDKDQLAVGAAHEMEHTKDKTMAQEIAMDHLSEDPDYYKKLKGIEKYDRVEREADGKTELDYGKEKLDKPMKKSLYDRWSLIKKDLDNSAAILDLATLSEDDEDEQQPEEAEQPEDQEMDPNGEEEAPGDEEQEDEEQEGDDSGRPEWLPEDVPHDDEQMEEEQDQDGEQDMDSEEGQQELIQALQEMGHSDAEIAHIVHGHMTPPVDEVKRAKAEAERAGMGHDEEAHGKEMEIRDQEAQIENEHAKRMKDVEYERAQKESGETDLDLEHKKRLQDLEYQKAAAESQFNEAAVEAEHKKRMLDLEYETAKEQKKLELQFKVKEHEMKLKHSEEIAKQKHQVQMQATKENGKMKLEENKAKIAERKADKKVKKSEDEDDDLSKAASWSYNPKTGQMGHSEHGFINVRPSTSGKGFDMVHNGKVVGTHDSHEGVKTALGSYMKQLGQSMKVSGAAPIPTVEGTARTTSTEMDDSPYTLQAKFQNQAKNRDMDRKANAGIKPPPDPSRPPAVIRNKAGQVMDLPERRYVSIPDLPKKEKV